MSAQQLISAWTDDLLSARLKSSFLVTIVESKKAKITKINQSVDTNQIMGWWLEWHSLAVGLFVFNDFHHYAHVHLEYWDAFISALL